MPQLGPETIEEALGMMVGTGLTLMVLTYLIFGDNLLYRLALHLFVGALVGYSLGIVMRDVFVAMVMAPLVRPNLVPLVPLLIGLWLLLWKGIPRVAYVGNFALAFLVGVGAAVALGGTLLGTLVPQIGAIGNALGSGSDLWGLVGGLIVAGGTVCTLMAFNFTARKRGGLAGIWGQFVELVGWFGRVLLTVAFAVAFAGALTTSLSILIGRIEYLAESVRSMPSIVDAVAGVPQTLLPQPPTPTPVPTPIPTPALEPDWVLHQHPTDGFSIALPSTWVEVDMNAATMDEALARCREYYPDMRFPFLEEQSIDDLRTSGTKLIALDMESRNREAGRYASVTVGKESLGQAATLDQVVQARVEQFRGQGMEIEHRRVTLPIGEAEEVRIPAAESVSGAAAVQYLIVRGEHLYVVGSGADADLAAEYEPVFQKIVQSFRWME